MLLSLLPYCRASALKVWWKKKVKLQRNLVFSNAGTPAAPVWERMTCATTGVFTRDGRDLSIIKMNLNGSIGISSEDKSSAYLLGKWKLMSLYPRLGCFTPPVSCSDKFLRVWAATSLFFISSSPARGFNTCQRKLGNLLHHWRL